MRRHTAHRKMVEAWPEPLRFGWICRGCDNYWESGETEECPECGSREIRNAGRVSEGKYPQRQPGTFSKCRQCGETFREDGVTPPPKENEPCWYCGGLVYELEPWYEKQRAAQRPIRGVREAWSKETEEENPPTRTLGMGYGFSNPADGEDQVDTDVDPWVKKEGVQLMGTNSPMAEDEEDKDDEGRPLDPERGHRTNPRDLGECGEGDSPAFTGSGTDPWSTSTPRMRGRGTKAGSRRPW